MNNTSQPGPPAPLLTHRPCTSTLHQGATAIVRASTPLSQRRIQGSWSLFSHRRPAVSSGQERGWDYRGVVARFAFDVWTAGSSSWPMPSDVQNLRGIEGSRHLDLGGSASRPAIKHSRRVPLTVRVPPRPRGSCTLYRPMPCRFPARCTPSDFYVEFKSAPVGRATALLEKWEFGLRYPRRSRAGAGRIVIRETTVMRGQLSDRGREDGRVRRVGPLGLPVMLSPTAPADDRGYRAVPSQRKHRARQFS